MADDALRLVVDAPITAPTSRVSAAGVPAARGQRRARVVCDVGAFADPDAVVIDALARLQLGTGRLGKTIELRHASAALKTLLTLMGLGAVLTFADE